MAGTLDPATEQRLVNFEKRLAELTLRVAELERWRRTAVEGSVDRSTIREKVNYDWQS